MRMPIMSMAMTLLGFFKAWKRQDGGRETSFSRCFHPETCIKPALSITFRATQSPAILVKGL